MRDLPAYALDHQETRAMGGVEAARARRFESEATFRQKPMHATLRAAAGGLSLSVRAHGPPAAGPLGAVPVTHMCIAMCTLALRLALAASQRLR